MGRFAWSWWLVAKDRDGRLEPLVVGDGGEGVFAVFRFEEDQMFLCLGGLADDGWRVR